jgi:hypothetical protein
MDHVAASTLAAIVIACRLIALAICGAIVVNHNATTVLVLLEMSHVAIWMQWMHVLIQVIMVKMIMMMAVCCSIRCRNICI